jgi:hypothetical protein
MSTEPLEIRSFRVVFALERRLHRIDRFRLPLPYGVPARSIGHACAILLAIVVAGRLPVLGALLHALPAPLRFCVLPAGGAALVARVRVDGRPPERFLWSAARHLAGPRYVDAFRRVPAPGSVRVIDEPISLVADLRSGWPRGRISGTGRVTVTASCRAVQRGRSLRLVPAAGTAALPEGPAAVPPGGWQIGLKRGQRVVLG